MLDIGVYSFNLVFTTFCPSCCDVRLVKYSGTCSVCSTRLDANAVTAIRKSIRERRQTFKGRLLRLAQRMHEVTDGPLEFKFQGKLLSPRDHFTHVITSTKQALFTLNEDVSYLVASQDWTSVRPERIAAFTKLVQMLDDALAKVTALLEAKPPLEWRAVHHELARGFISSVRGHVFMALTLNASDGHEAEKVQADGALAFADAKEHIERAEGLINLAFRLPDDGPFLTDGSLDVAAITWASVGHKSAPIAQGADIARKSFAQVPDVGTLPNERAIMLLPAVASGAGVIDHTFVVELATSLRETLDTLSSSPWVMDAALLVEHVSRGLNFILDSSERLGREWRHGLPRHHIMRTLTEVYRDLIEGALIDVGAPIIIAGRAFRGENNASYEADVVDGIKAGEAVEAVERLAPLSRGTVELTFRNASAHAGIKVTETGVIATAIRSEDGRVISRKEIPLTDVEFFEELVELQELLLALQLAILPWLWSNPDSRIKMALAEELPTIQQCNQVLSLLGGLAGLHNVTLDTASGDVTISTEQRTEAVSNPDEISILSLVPATFVLSPEIKRVTLNIVDRKPTMFERAEFMDVQENALHSPELLSLTTTKWLVVSGGRWLEQDEAMYIIVPLTQLSFDLAQFISQQPYQAKNIQHALDSWKVVKKRLNIVLPMGQRRYLTQKTVQQLDAFYASIKELAKSRALGKSAEAQLYAEQAVTVLNSIHDIQQRALTLRDASKGGG